ncbi:unnamed protein product [Urochloa humidicola]
MAGVRPGGYLLLQSGDVAALAMAGGGRSRPPRPGPGPTPPDPASPSFGAWPGVKMAPQLGLEPGSPRL